MKPQVRFLSNNTTKNVIVSSRFIVVLLICSFGSRSYMLKNERIHTLSFCV